MTFLTPRSTAPRSDPRQCADRQSDVDVKLFADGALLARAQSALEVVKVGLTGRREPARDFGLLYGLATALMALLTGWLASVVFSEGLRFQSVARVERSETRGRSVRNSPGFGSLKPGYALERRWRHA